MSQDRIISREISWLAFNERVLQEAEDPTVPLLERLKFLGIFSSNQDEFFRVRMAGLKKISKVEKTAYRILGESPTELYNLVQATILRLKDRFDQTYIEIRAELEKENVFIIDESQLDKQQSLFVRAYFHNNVRPTLYPVILDDDKKFPELDDKGIYLAIRLIKVESDTKKKNYSLIKIPTDVLSRFLVLPDKNDKKYIILLDDVIRHNLEDIYQIFKFDYAEAYTIKVTREAGLNVDNDFSETLLEALEKGLKKRDKGEPNRLVFDRAMPDGFKKFMIKSMKLKKLDTIISGARYHNFKDFIGFPDINRPDLLNKRFKTLVHPELSNVRSLISVIRKKDVLLSVPYQSFNHLLDLLREAAIDPNVTQISMTFYRIAQDSNVVNALINAIRNGKKVFAVVEPLARFDERSNINLANRLRDEGAEIVFGIRGFKVHTKIVLIERKVGKRESNIACISTGNFNEITSKIYSDHILMTANTKITNEVKKLFDFFNNRIVLSKYSHLMVAPFNFRKKLVQLISREAKFAKEGKKAEIIIKTNHISDEKLLNKLYGAGEAGVKVKIIVRTTCGIIPGQKFSKNIEAQGVVDSFLEHARVYKFHNGGDPVVYLGSGDLLTRNFDYRVELMCPLLDPDIKQQMIDILDIEWSDNVKARTWNAKLTNDYVQAKKGEARVRSQYEIYKYLSKLSSKKKVEKKQVVEIAKA